ncbi:MAG: hypothetical protein IJM17_01835 [Firmicutes bacterium]|nr:hypothetical protein [Bacillota bacterium]
MALAGIEQKHIVKAEQLDGRGLLRLSSLFTYFQDIAGDHSTLLDCGADELAARGFFWAVTNYRAEISRLPEEGEELLLATCIGKPSHAIYPRYFRLFDEDEKLIASCASRWALVDIVKRSAAVNSPLEKVFTGPKNPWELKEAGPVKPADTSKTFDFSLPPEYIDRNGHMNNARYFDMAESMLAGDTEGLFPCFAAMEYRSELLPGKPMKVGTGEIDTQSLAEACDKAFYLCGNTEEAQIFRMKLGYMSRSALQTLKE